MQPGGVGVAVQPHCGTSDEFPCSADKAHMVAASRNQCFVVVTSTQTQVTLPGKHCLYPRRRRTVA